MLTTLLCLTLSSAALASIPRGQTLKCDMDETFTFIEHGEIFPQPFSVIVNDIVFEGSLRPVDQQVIDFRGDAFIRVDGNNTDGYIIQYKLGNSADDLSQVAFGCFLLR